MGEDSVIGDVVLGTAGSVEFFEKLFVEKDDIPAVVILETAEELLGRVVDEKELVSNVTVDFSDAACSFVVEGMLVIWFIEEDICVVLKGLVVFVCCSVIAELSLVTVVG